MTIHSNVLFHLKYLTLISPHSPNEQKQKQKKNTINTESQWYTHIGTYIGKTCMQLQKTKRERAEEKKTYRRNTHKSIQA